MKLATRKVLCLLLTLVFAVSLLLPAFAAEKAGCSYYTVLGDSIASAYGTTGYEKLLNSGNADGDCKYVEGSYADLVAKALGIPEEKVNMRSHSGWRTTEMLRMLDPSFEYDNDAYSKYYKSDFFLRALNARPWSAFDGESERIIEAIGLADLITLNIGTNDIFSYAIAVTFNKYSYILEESGILDLEGTEGLTEAFTALLSLAKENEIRGILTEFVTAIETGFAMYRENFPVLIKKIRALNPAAELVVIGIANPINIAIDIIGDFSIDLYTITDLLVDRVNSFTKTCEVKDEFVFADVKGVKNYGIGVLDWDKLIHFDKEVKYSAVKIVHPTDEGHAFMAEKILEALTGKDHTPVVTGSYTLLKNNKLSWDKVDGAVSYRVYRATEENGEYELIMVTLLTGHTDLLTKKGQNYYYKVAAVMDLFGKEVTAMSEPVLLTAK